VVTILNQIYEVGFKGFSYGFRPGRSPQGAPFYNALDIQVDYFRRARRRVPFTFSLLLITVK
jgi:hypothetical protein